MLMGSHGAEDDGNGWLGWGWGCAEFEYASE